MFDSLPYRNDAATIFRRLIRSLPTRSGVLGVATCDKGLPAMMMALAATRDLPCVLVPGGVTLLPTEGEDAGRVQTIGVRFVHGDLSLEQAADLGCRACASPGGGCQFLGTAATSQVVGEALGLSLGHSALAPSGQPIWLDMARRSARALDGAPGARPDDAGHPDRGVAAQRDGRARGVRRLDESAAARAGDRPCRGPAATGGRRLGGDQPQRAASRRRAAQRAAQSPHDAGVPGRRRARGACSTCGAPGLLDTSVLTVEGGTLGEQLDAWEASERRAALRQRLRDLDGVDPDDVIMSPDAAAKRGLASTMCLPTGNVAPEGAVIKSTAIDPSVVDADGVYPIHRSGEGLRQRAGGDRRDQGQAASRPATCWC